MYLPVSTLGGKIQNVTRTICDLSNFVIFEIGSFLLQTQPLSEHNFSILPHVGLLSTFLY